MERLLFLLALLLAPVPALAASGASCHCFRDRTFDAGNPAAANPYVLATSQNSLLAAAFGVEKKGIVSAKMTGTPGEDLWVAHWAGPKLGLRPAELLDARSRATSWSDALAGLGVGAQRLGPEAAEVLSRPGGDQALAGLVVDDILATRLEVPREALEKVRAAGASDAATAAASILSRLGGKSPADLYAAVVSGGASWSALFHAVGVEPTGIEGAVRKLLR